MELRARQETPRVSSRLFLRSLLEVRHYSNDTLVSLPSRSLPPFPLIAPFSWAAPDGAPPFLSGRLGCFTSARVTRNKGSCKKTITITIINNNYYNDIYYKDNILFSFKSMQLLNSIINIVFILISVCRENDQIIGSYLEIEDVTLEDYGEYKCEVSNGVDEEITLAAHVYRQVESCKSMWSFTSCGTTVRIEPSEWVLAEVSVSSPCFPNCIVPESYVLQIERGEFFMELLILKVHETREDNLVDGKECDALVCYHEKDSSLVIGIVIPTLESRHRYKCAALELSQLNHNCKYSRPLLALISGGDDPCLSLDNYVVTATATVYPRNTRVPLRMVPPQSLEYFSKIILSVRFFKLFYIFRRSHLTSRTAVKNRSRKVPNLFRIFFVNVAKKKRENARDRGRKEEKENGVSDAFRSRHRVCTIHFYQLIPSYGDRQHTLIGSLEISPHANTTRRIVVVLSPASLDNIWTDASVGAVLKQLSSLPTRVIVVTLKRLPSTTATIAKRSRRDRRDADNTSFDRLTILSWQDGGGGSSGGNGTAFGSGGRKFWYKLRLAMPAMRPMASETGCQSVAMIVQANGKCGQQKARSRESLEVLV
ncbi:hypothetical protein ALC60_04673 [Trachymyrmex zeteki]|uniref:Ig-like domain-containing protein n=1 Tax=Mycetomoellerius zeteki TaxID=64791 RepID=A0A151X7W1_9HYME|nr:hypothetical protein ALC60_04673 [Trachymyrmex zeteki]